MQHMLHSTFSNSFKPVSDFILGSILINLKCIKYTHRWCLYAQLQCSLGLASKVKCDVLEEMCLFLCTINSLCYRTASDWF